MLELLCAIFITDHNEIDSFVNNLAKIAWILSTLQALKPRTRQHFGLVIKHFSANDLFSRIQKRQFIRIIHYQLNETFPKPFNIFNEFKQLKYVK
uniref:Uncharacterized protein n=1 Tax=Onchocerca volvulus TaxID=6282 RepID=A0A8R1U0Q0_ONCVO